MLRSLARGVARRRMEKKGVVKPCKKDKRRGIESYFQNHWREYV